MDTEMMKMFCEYGFAGIVTGAVLIWFARYLTPKIDENSRNINALTLALTELTQSVNNLYASTQKAFDDNRRTIEILMAHIEQKNR